MLISLACFSQIRLLQISPELSKSRVGEIGENKKERETESVSNWETVVPSGGMNWHESKKKKKKRTNQGQKGKNLWEMKQIEETEESDE